MAVLEAQAAEAARDLAGVAEFPAVVEEAETAEQVCPEQIFGIPQRAQAPA